MDHDWRVCSELRILVDANVHTLDMTVAISPLVNMSIPLIGGPLYEAIDCTRETIGE